MTVTRDVIYDLLPAYFAGEVSEDTRTLVEDFFATDPDFAQMAKRFGTLLNERRPGDPRAERDVEKEAFARARARLGLRWAAVAWALGAALALGIAALTGLRVFGLLHPGVIIAIVFGLSAVGTWLSSYHRNAHRIYASFTGENDGKHRREGAR